MGSIEKIEEIDITKLQPYEKNAKKHGKGQIEKIKASILEFGFLTPCLIDKDFNLIAGHGRLAAAEELGLKKLPCVFIEGLTEDQRRAYILADNRLSELGEWDMDLVSEELEELNKHGFDLELTGFEFDDITSDDIDFSDLDAQANKIEEELSEEPKTKPGDIYYLGDHVLMCGDSRKPEDVEKLMRSDQADLCITDPPYNNDYEGKTKDALKIKNDSMTEIEFEKFLSDVFQNMKNQLKNGAAFYIWLPSLYIDIFMNALKKNGLETKELLIWVKNVFTLGRQDYQWRHEPCIYGWKEGAAHYFVEDRTKSTIFESKPNVDNLNESEAKQLLKAIFCEMENYSTVIHEKRPTRNAEHPTMKPVNLIKRQIENSSKEGDLVLDLFGGSGTTLIACEEKRRRCRMMEYDPHYCDVIINRFEKLTGKTAKKVNQET